MSSHPSDISNNADESTLVRLSQESGVPPYYCKKALFLNNGDYAKALAYLLDGQWARFAAVTILPRD